MKILFYICASFTLIFSNIYASNKNPNTKPNYSQVSGQIINLSVQKIESIPRIKCVGSGLSMPGGPIRQATVCFYVRGPMSIDELREILVTSALEIVEAAQQIPHINDCLHTPPFTLDTLEIVLFNNDPEGRNTYDPNIAVANLYHEIIEYRTYDPNFDIPKTKNRSTETFEEARKIVNAQNDIRKDAN